MHLSVLLSSLPIDFEPALHQAAALGFRHVDVVGLVERPPSHREALADTDLLVSCAAIGRGLPEGHALDAADIDLRRATVAQVQQQIADAAGLGATHCYLVPGMDGSHATRQRFTDACTQLADYAAQRMVRLCVEHIPGRALPTVAATLTWLDEARHDNLSLLLDIGHCLITQENPAAAVHSAGERLGYVHLDDNDGIGDLHWPLLTGRLTDEMLRAFLSALQAIGYSGALTLELNPQNPDPVAALRQSAAVCSAAQAAL